MVILTEEALRHHRIRIPRAQKHLGFLTSLSLRHLPAFRLYMLMAVRSLRELCFPEFPSFSEVCSRFVQSLLG